jgi:hypothetical protein
LREELGLTHSVMAFENLNELLAVLDQSAESHSKMIKRYEDRLGVLLRQAKDSTDPRVQAVSSQFTMTSDFGGVEDSQQQQQQQQQQAQNGKRDDNNKKRKDDRKRDSSGEEKGWIVLESEDLSLKIASGSDSLVSSNEISILFKIIETLKSKLPAIEAARKLLSELPSQGFRTDRRLRVVFKDGVPRYVLPSTEPQSAPARKFRYSEQFRIAVLK